MKRLIRRILLLIFIFAAAFGGFVVYQQYTQTTQQTDSYETMQAATLATVQLQYLENGSNTLRGYTQKMEISTMRGCITPLSQEHKLSIWIDQADHVDADQISYEVRGLDGTRLVEDGTISGWERNGSTMTAQLQLSNLVDEGNEYKLILCVNQSGTPVYYYSRILYLAEGHTESMVGFARDFMQASIDGNSDFIVNYIQPNETMGTDDFGYVNQHSRSGMITWKGLSPQAGTVETTLTELSDSQASVTLTYPITLSSNGESKECMVNEQYVVRFRNDVLYLLDFERHVKEQFSVSAPVYAKSALKLGITDESVSGMASDDENIQTYVYDGQLFVTNTKENTLDLIYTYQDGAEDSSALDDYKLQPIRVEDSGDIYFMAYGYHSRGNHEGQVGVSFLHYKSAEKSEESSIDEIFYIPVTFSEEILMKNMGTLAYVNNESDLMYLLYQSTVYSIDLSSGEKAELAVAPSAGSFYSNASSSLIAWEEGDSGYPNLIRIADLSTGKTYRVAAEDGEFVQIQGFLGDDLVYGTARKSDVFTQAGQVVQKPMYKLTIVDFAEDMTQSGEYQMADYYIEGTQILENQLEIYRLTKDASTGAYAAAADDQMFFNNRSDKKATSLTKSQIVDGFQKVWSISLAVDTEKIQTNGTLCKIRDAAAAYQLKLDDSSVDELYYVYARGKLQQIDGSLVDAINTAYDEMGVVVDDRAKYIWTRGTRALNKNLTFEEQTAQSSDDSLRACLEILVAAEGGKASEVESLLSDGIAIDDVIAQAMGSTTNTANINDSQSNDAQINDGQSKNASGRVENLRGCSVTQVLYYINENHLVLAVTGDNSALLLTGYDTQNVSIYDPVTAEVTTMAIADAQNYFAQYDCAFLAWLP